ncbi:MAG: hypothetical protein V7647_3111 [Acidobacteriota bacterium]|jgi:hypothetical protein
MRRSSDLAMVLSLAALLAGAACSRPAPPAANDAARPAPGDSPAAATATAPIAPDGQRPSTAAQPNSANVPVLAEFEARVKEYVALHQKLEATLPKLPKDATPQQIDSHQRALGRLVQQARAGAKPGSIFTPDVRAVVQKLMAQVFGGPDGAALKASIMDENPVGITLTVNGRYPDTVPLSTVPPQVLQGLPRLPEELEFRFIGRHLILMDEHAHLIVDLIENVLPA